MTKPSDRARLLTINGGSSSLKFAVFEPGDPPSRAASGRVERVGRPDAQIVVTDSAGASQRDDRAAVPDHAAAFELVRAWLESTFGLSTIAGVGHRVVHGGR